MTSCAVPLLAFLLLLFMTPVAEAGHKWICSGDTAYHWSSTSVTVQPADEQTASGGLGRDEDDYHVAYDNAVLLWDSTSMSLSYSSSGDVELFYDTYGANGWLGLATISPSNCVIQSATAQLNDTYLGNGSYSQTAVDHVACQEVGHTFGLDHNRNANDTCMNDTILTAGNQINQHDEDTLFCIYNTCNQSPNAFLSWNNPYGLRVDFDASGSSDPDGSIVAYHWDFDDGYTTTTSGPKISHTYASEGNKFPTVTVEDDDGATDTDFAYVNLCGGSGFICTESTAGSLAPTASAKGEAEVLGSVTWLVEAGSAGELTAAADLVVVARAVAQQPGRVAGDDGGEVPFTLHGFVIDEVVKGQPEGRTLLVERTGGLLPDGRRMVVDDGGSFEPQKTYLLFLERKESHLYYQINPQGRYEVDHDVLRGVDIEDPVVRSLHGKSLRDAVDQLRSELRQATPRRPR